jgi:malonate transporter and related proteins
MLNDLSLMAGALIPVFALVALGWVIFRFKLVTEQGVEDLNRLVFYVILPAQLFIMVSRSDLVNHFDLKSLAAAMAGFLGGWLGCWILAARLPAMTRGTLVSGIGRPNAAFIGLPVMELVAQTMPADDAAIMMTAFGVLLGIMISAFNAGTIVALRLAHHGLNRSGLIHIGIQMLINPMIITCVIGMIASVIKPNLLHGSLPGTTIELLATAAIPASLLLTGMQLDLGLVRRHPGLLTIGSFGKLIAVPAITYLVGLLLAVNPNALIAAVILNACPVAVATVPMARLLGGDAVFMAALVVVSTVCAPVAMLVWLLILR